MTQRVKNSNYRPKYRSVHNLCTERHLTTDHYEPHKKLVRQMMKEEKKHQKISDKNPKAVLTLRRIEKKFASLSRKLKWLLGMDNDKSF